jgi:GH24 family phage-related lysozyme (muramidase)
LLAVINEFEDVVSYQRNLLTSGISQSEVIFGAVTGVILLAFGAAFVFRKQLLRRRRKHHRHRPPAQTLATRYDSGKSNRKRHRRRRKRRSNPTLAETGGLPSNQKQQSTATSSS